MHNRKHSNNALKQKHACEKLSYGSSKTTNIHMCMLRTWSAQLVSQIKTSYTS